MLGIYKKFQKSIELTEKVRRNLESGRLQVPRGQWVHADTWPNQPQLGQRRWRYNGLIKLGSRFDYDQPVRSLMLPPGAFVEFCKEDNQRCKGLRRSNGHYVALKYLDPKPTERDDIKHHGNCMCLECYTPHTPEPTPRKFTARERGCLNMSPAYILTLLVSLWIS